MLAVRVLAVRMLAVRVLAVYTRVGEPRVGVPRVGVRVLAVRVFVVCIYACYSVAHGKRVIYRIAGNFRGIKFSRKCENRRFRGENFRGSTVGWDA